MKDRARNSDAYQAGIYTQLILLLTLFAVYSSRVGEQRDTAAISFSVSDVDGLKVED